jgi:hypothetical protein
MYPGCWMGRAAISLTSKVKVKTMPITLSVVVESLLSFNYTDPFAIKLNNASLLMSNHDLIDADS